MKQEEVSIEDDAGKLFVGGLSRETSEEKLQEYFSRFGEVADCVVMKSTETGKSRGFGFVTFKDSTCAAKVLSSGPHELDNRTIDPKVCSAKDMQQSKKMGTYPKVFLGGLPPNTTETDLRSFFSRYGTVMEVVLMYDQERKKSRGFGFLSFETEDSVKQVCAEHFVKINGKKIECKHAEPRGNTKKPQQPQQANGAPAQQQWTGTPQMGPTGWGPGAAAPPGPPGPCGPPMGGPMNTGPMMGYQGGWGPGPYGPPQGGWGPPPPGPYGPPGYGGWGYGPGYGPPGPYGPPGYGGYGYGGYGYGPQMGGPPPPNPPAPGTENNFSGGNNNNNNQNNAPPASNNSAPAPQSGPPPGMGTNYQQDNSNFGPARTGFPPGYGGAPNNYGPPGNYPPQGNYGPQGDQSQGNRPNNQAGPGFHPYRR